MPYTVKEIFYTLQGEGANAGRPAVFCRFAGCNLWTGREPDRPHAVCQFCDTDFIGINGPGGGKFEDASALAEAVANKWPREHSSKSVPLVVCTGGEPLLQLDSAAVDGLHRHGFEIAIETNGTRIPPPGVDWICVSPKVGAPLLLTKGSELKLVFPQNDGEPERFTTMDFDYFYLQPMDGPRLRDNIESAIRYCLDHPQWRLSLQTHKMIGIR